MRLKAISIVGFKSFADRVMLQFVDGITGIIGPNGSGKSNTLDAVRWVMGEQSAKNLKDPTDIIFAGSENRKPQSMAEVSLTFTNDGNGCPPEFIHLPEITIGRRIYRNGEREYLFNKEPCRLKDIVEFLMGVGLGSRTYSIIQQEKRDRIIAATPDDLRDILEETAGITIFKQHRKDAEKRMDSTKENMVRVAQIETEINSQRENLVSQVEKLGEKNKLLSEIKQNEIRLVSHRVGFFRSLIGKLKQEIEKNNEQSQKTELTTIEWETTATDLTATQLELKQQIDNVENELDEARMSYTRFSERSGNIAKQILEKETRKKVLEQEVAIERQNLLAEEERLAKFVAEHTNTEQLGEKIRGEIETLQNTLEEVEESYLVERGRGEEIRSELRALESALSNLRAKNEACLDAITKSNNQIKRKNEQIDLELSEKRKLEADLTSLQATLSQKSSGMDEVASERGAIDLELKSLVTEVNQLQENRDLAKEKYLEINSTLTSLQNLQSANNGLSDGAKVIRERFNHLLSGFVFENITVHAEDERILEQTLPDILQAAYIENNENLIDILDKIEELDLSRVGFVTKEFLTPLSKQELETKQAILAIHGLRCVGDRCSAESKPELRNLLNRIFIANDEWLLFKAHKENSLDKGLGFIFVSERGVVLSNCTNINFGAATQTEAVGILQRKRQIAEYGVQKELVQAELAQAEGNLFKISERKKALDAKLGTLEHRLSLEKVEVLKLASSVENIILKVKHTTDGVERIQEEMQSLQTEITLAKESFAKNQEQIEKLESEGKSYKQYLSEFEISLEDKREQKNSLQMQIQNKKSDLNLMEERQANFRRTYEEISLHIKRVQQKVDKGIAELSESNSRISDTKSELETLQREVNKLSESKQELEFELDTLMNSEAETSEQLRVIESKIKSQKDIIASKQKLLQDKNMEIARYNAFLDTAEKDAKDRFNLSSKDLPSEPEDIPQLEAKLEQEISKLKLGLGELGPVNERALEEFQSVEERRLFLIEQKNDIENSLAGLQKVITDIEETTKTRFTEIFIQVDTEFQKLFPILFPGGEARLNMLNPADLLTTGVEILVRLPGKRQQNMNLFSGGEKALTAISLIFALLKTHPAPFCFLDEVDAPLDEANVGRFSNVLDALSDQFQFIVITHNRRTMEILDHIYGISMPEPGVSKSVSVDFTDVPTHLSKKSKPAVVAATPPAG